jgi:thiamine biosynthesis lipoprotein ApbE
MSAEATNRYTGAKRRGKPWRTTISDPAALKRPDLVLDALRMALGTQGADVLLVAGPRLSVHHE